MSDKIQFTCPHCSRQMQLPSSTVGKQGKCPGCRQVVMITASVRETPADDPFLVATAPLSPQPDPLAASSVSNIAPATPLDSSPPPVQGTIRKSRSNFLWFTHALTAAGAVALTLFLGSLFSSDDATDTGNTVTTRTDGDEKSVAGETEDGSPDKQMVNNETESINDTYDDLGRRAFEAMRNLNATQLKAVNIQGHNVESFQALFMSKVADPQLKGAAEQDFFRVLPRPENGFFLEMAEDAQKTIERIKFGEHEDEFGRIINPEVIRSATYIGSLLSASKTDGFRDGKDFYELCRKYDVDPEEIGFALTHSATVYFEAEGHVYSFSPNEITIKLENKWFYTGDGGFSVPRLLTSATSYLDEIDPIDLDSHSRRILSKVRQLLK